MFRRLALASLWVAAFAWSIAAACAATPKAAISGPTSVPMGGAIVLDGRGAVTDKPLVWRQKQGPSLGIMAMTPEGGPEKSMLLAYPNVAGEYQFEQVAKGKPDGKDELDSDSTTFAVSVLAPPPTPLPPDPGPPGPPVPPVPPAPEPAPDDGTKPRPPPATADPLDVTLVVDTLAMTPALAAVRDSPTIADAVKPLSARWHTLTTASPLVASLNYAPVIARVGGAPALVIVNTKTHTVVDARKCPATEAEILALVAQIRGK